MANKNTKKPKRRTPTDAQILRLQEQEEQEELFLQRRETIATACLQGILASGRLMAERRDSHGIMVAASVALAETLIEALDAEEEDEEDEEEDEEDEDEEDESDDD